jgi:hypothetical protein
MNKFEIIEKFKNSFVACGQFSVLLKDATQEQLEHLYHLAHPAISVKQGKKVKDKKVDNFDTEEQQ